MPCVTVLDPLASMLKQLLGAPTLFVSAIKNTCASHMFKGHIYFLQIKLEKISSI
jgi:hypothetical protein